MELTVVIVNYNVKYFLEQCLFSVENAMRGIEGEVYVVDNESVDGSVSMIRSKFPNVHLIENNENVGFSRANNQAMRIAKGEFVLLLNPDTLVEEDTFSKCLNFMKLHPEAGGLGVRMIDGNGNFLPESKRGLPSPSVAFYKIFGLSRIFPKSRKFGKYHLSYLSKNETNEIEVLSGAYMFMRSKTLKKVGLLDEEFFMYGEDIDLSYRITLGGYKNYYFPDTTIIHYKGESTKKGSINYVLVFYNAMIIFARKHFSSKRANMFSFFIKLAVYLRATLAILNRSFQIIIAPILDFSLIFIFYKILLPFWEDIIFSGQGTYPKLFYNFVIPAYIIAWILGVFIAGGYRKPIKILAVLKGVGIGTVLILIIYALLSNDLRFSRFLIFIGAAAVALIFTGVRYLFHRLNIKGFQLSEFKRKRIVIVGGKSESARVLSIMQQMDIKTDFVGFVTTNTDKIIDNCIGNFEQLAEIIQINRIDEVIFCAKNLSSQVIISKMLALSGTNVEYKIAPPESLSIIGSNSIDTAGELYVYQLNSIASKKCKRQKRFLDIFVSISFILLFPLLILYTKNIVSLFRNIIKVLIGKKTWVGYADNSNIEQKKLPKIKAGILCTTDLHKRKKIAKETILKLNTIYAKNYSVITDLLIIYYSLKKVSRISK